MSAIMENDSDEMIVKRVSVPIGLEELMEGLTKEVLLKKPDDIYLFAAEYFSKLLSLREKGNYKVKTVTSAQSVTRRVSKPPSEKLLIRGAAKQLSRQISVRSDSPTKKNVPVKKQPVKKDQKDDKPSEKSKFLDRRSKMRKSETAEVKHVEVKPLVTPRQVSEGNEEKHSVTKRDRSVSSNRRGRSVTKSSQSTPRQKSTSTPRASKNESEQSKTGKEQSKEDDKGAKSGRIKEKQTPRPIKDDSGPDKLGKYQSDGRKSKGDAAKDTEPQLVKNLTIDEISKDSGVESDINENHDKPDKDKSKDNKAREESKSHETKDDFEESMSIENQPKPDDNTIDKTESDVKDKQVVPKTSSVEEATEFVKDGKLAVLPPKVIQRSQQQDNEEVITSLNVPQLTKGEKVEAKIIDQVTEDGDKGAISIEEESKSSENILDNEKQTSNGDVQIGGNIKEKVKTVEDKLEKTDEIKEIVDKGDTEFKAENITKNLMVMESNTEQKLENENKPECDKIKPENNKGDVESVHSLVRQTSSDERNRSDDSLSEKTNSGKNDLEPKTSEKGGLKDDKEGTGSEMQDKKGIDTTHAVQSETEAATTLILDEHDIEKKDAFNTNSDFTKENKDNEKEDTKDSLEEKLEPDVKVDTEILKNKEKDNSVNNINEVQSETTAAPTLIFDDHGTQKKDDINTKENSTKGNKGNEKEDTKDNLKEKPEPDVNVDIEIQSDKGDKKNVEVKGNSVTNINEVQSKTKAVPTLTLDDHGTENKDAINSTKENKDDEKEDMKDCSKEKPESNVKVDTEILSDSNNREMKEEKEVRDQDRIQVTLEKHPQEVEKTDLLSTETNVNLEGDKKTAEEKDNSVTNINNENKLDGKRNEEIKNVESMKESSRIKSAQVNKESIDPMANKSLLSDLNKDSSINDGNIGKEHKPSSDSGDIELKAAKDISEQNVEKVTVPVDLDKEQVGVDQNTSSLVTTSDSLSDKKDENEEKLESNSEGKSIEKIMEEQKLTSGTEEDKISSMHPLENQSKQQLLEQQANSAEEPSEIHLAKFSDFKNANEEPITNDDKDEKLLKSAKDNGKPECEVKSISEVETNDVDQGVLEKEGIQGHENNLANKLEENQQDKSNLLQENKTAKTADAMKEISLARNIDVNKNDKERDDLNNDEEITVNDDSSKKREAMESNQKQANTVLVPQDSNIEFKENALIASNVQSDELDIFKNENVEKKESGIIIADKDNNDNSAMVEVIEHPTDKTYNNALLTQRGGENVKKEEVNKFKTGQNETTTGNIDEFDKQNVSAMTKILDSNDDKIPEPREERNKDDGSISMEHMNSEPEDILTDRGHHEDNQHTQSSLEKKGLDPKNSSKNITKDDFPSENLIKPTDENHLIESIKGTTLNKDKETPSMEGVDDLLEKEDHKHKINTNTENIQDAASNDKLKSDGAEIKISEENKSDQPGVDSDSHKHVEEIKTKDTLDDKVEQEDDNGKMDVKQVTPVIQHDPVDAGETQSVGKELDGHSHNHVEEIKTIDKLDDKVKQEDDNGKMDLKQVTQVIQHDSVDAGETQSVAKELDGHSHKHVEEIKTKNKLDDKVAQEDDNGKMDVKQFTQVIQHDPVNAGETQSVDKELDGHLGKDLDTSDKHITKRDVTSVNALDKATFEPSMTADKILEGNNIVEEGNNNVEVEAVINKEQHEEDRDSEGVVQPKLTDEESSNLNVDNTKENTKISSLMKTDSNVADTSKPPHTETSYVTDVINLVLSVVKEKPVDNIVKTFLNDFIHKEKQNTFVEHLIQPTTSNGIKEYQNDTILIQSTESTKNVPEEDKIDLQSNVVTSTNFGNTIKEPLSDLKEKEKENTFIKQIGKDETDETDTDVNDEIKTMDEVKSITSPKESSKESKVIQADTMEKVINATKSLAETGLIDDIVKEHINDFLHNEKKNTFKFNHDIEHNSKESDQIQLLSKETESKSSTISKMEEDKDQGNSEVTDKSHSNRTIRQLKGDNGNVKTDFKKTKSKFTSQTNIKLPEEETKKINKPHGKKMRRIKTVDVIKDDSKTKPEVKSRLPTADYRHRVKYEKENGKHAVLIKQQSPVLKQAPKKSSESVNVADFELKQSNIITENKQKENVSDSSDKNTIKDVTETGGLQKATEGQKNGLEKEILGKDQSNFDISKLHEELEAVERETKVTAKPLSDENGTNKESNELQKVIAALKIQSLWRGYSVRQNKLSTKKDDDAKTVENRVAMMRSDTYNLNDINENSHKKTRDEDLKQTVKAKTPILDGKTDDEEGKTDSLEFSNAAKIIQKVWRGFQIRKNKKHTYQENIVMPSHTDKEENKADDLTEDKTQNLESAIEDDSQLRKTDVNEPDTKENPSKQGSIKDQHLNNVEEIVNESIDDSKFRNAATTIQRIWRGFKVRTNLKTRNGTKEKPVDSANSSLILRREDKYQVNEKNEASISSKAKEKDCEDSLEKSNQGTIKKEETTAPATSTLDSEARVKSESESEKQLPSVSGHEISKLIVPSSTIIKEEGSSDNVDDKIHNENAIPSGYKSEQKFIAAAVMIQKLWRGFKVRKHLKSVRDHTIKYESIKTESGEKKRSKRELRDESKDNMSNIHVDNEQFIKAAIRIQKIWRGFNVRKNLQRDGPFGRKVEITHPPAETIEVAEKLEVKDKKSALKIQSLWRGYQVRKNIGIIKNKLEEKDAAGVEKERELSDGDVLNAATKIQAGIRGYLQRKRYKRGMQLKSITEEDENKANDEINRKEMGTVIHQNTEELDGETNSDKKVLSETEIFKALQKLDHLTIPNDPPIIEDVKPPFYRSTTVEEPVILKEHRPRLSKSVSLDNNNNNSEKFNNHNLLDLKLKEPTNDNIKEDADNSIVKQSIAKYDKGYNLDKSKSVSLKDTQKRHTGDSSLKDVHATDDSSKLNVHLEDTTDKENNKIVDLEENLINKPVSEPKSQEKLKLTGNLEKLSTDNQYDNDNTNNNTLNIEKATIRNFKNDVGIKTESNVEEKTTSQDTPLNVSSEDTQSENEGEIYKRSVSLESNDSAVTVIESSDDKKDSDSNDTSSEIENHIDMHTDTIKEPFIEHENLINDFQNKLLDHISGKNGDATEDIGTKFDIEKLRRELKEAGIIYNTSHNTDVKHQNSKEEISEQLQDYLKDLHSYGENEDHGVYTENADTNTLLRNMPDIKEEEGETKSSEKDNNNSDENENHHATKDDESYQGNNSNEIKKNISESETSIEKIQSTLRECESIANEINMGFKNIDSQNVNAEKNVDTEDNKHVPLSQVPCKESDLSNDKVRNDIPPGHIFCPDGQLNSNCINSEHIPEDVELINTTASTDEKEENSKVEGCLSSAKNDKATKNNDMPNDLSSNNDAIETEAGNSNKLLHTGELHDTVIVPLQHITRDTESEMSHTPEDMHEKVSSEDKALTTDFASSGLLHTGELHDTVIVPMPVSTLLNDSGCQVDQKTVTEETVNSPKRLTAAEITDLSKDSPHEVEFTTNKSSKGLLHTGELHDTVVVSIPLKMDISENHPPSIELVKRESPSEATQQNLPETKVVPENTGLLHTGELHDTVVISLPTTSQVSAEVGHGEGNEEKTETPRRVDSESQTTGGNAVPIAVQLSQAPAGAAALTSPRSVSGGGGGDVICVDGGVTAQAPDKGALPDQSGSELSAPPGSRSMESEKRKNATINNKSMEAEAATKIQAGFRGYQVRKQLKLKNGSSDIHSQRRQARRKSSGRITDSGRIAQNKPKESNEIEEKSAVKIQAGVRGFLVRRRQKKLKTQEA